MSMSMSRRRMLQLTGVTTLGAATMAALQGCSQGTDSADPAADSKTPAYSLTVYSPAGVVAITQHFAERLDTLEGKIIGFVSNGSWEDDRTFPVIQEYLETTYHCTVYDQFQFPFGKDTITVDNNGVAEVALGLGVDAMIVGNAG